MTVGGIISKASCCDAPREKLCMLTFLLHLFKTCRSNVILSSFFARPARKNAKNLIQQFSFVQDFAFNLAVVPQSGTL